MTIAEVYDAILGADLYQFKADKPLHVVQSQIRRHCSGLNFPSASATKLFDIVTGGKYTLLQGAQRKTQQTDPSQATNDALCQLHQKYLVEFRQRVLSELQSLDPASFEVFCRNLLSAYGFREVCVTQVSRDGGIDGHGQLKVGFAYFNVAFQCKRWKQRPVGRPEVDKLRGAIQGQFDQGIFFTTANFSPDAQRASFKSGAVPIVLINGSTIVDIMIEHGFGVETEQLPIYNLAIDLAISADDVTVGNDKHRPASTSSSRT
jgi:restriction system protein